MSRRGASAPPGPVHETGRSPRLPPLRARGGAGGEEGVRARGRPIQPAGPIFADPAETPAALPRRILGEIFAHALEADPEECCGLLTGRGPGAFEGVHRCRNDMTRLHHEDPARWPRDGKAGFHMAETDYLRVAREAEARGRRVTGVYHSHVGASAYFSELDQEYALQEGFPFPEAEHLVVGLVEGRVREVAAFRRSAGGARGTPPFAARPVVVAEP